MKLNKSVKKRVIYILMTLIAIIWLLPIVMLILASYRSTSEFYASLNLFSIPETFNFSNYIKAWTEGNLGLYIKNGLFVTFLKVPLGIICSSMCAFALTRLEIKHSEKIFVFILVGMMLPIQLTLIPLNTVYSNFGLTNTYTALVFTYIGFGIPMGTLVFRGFFKSIPKELDEAAAIDGCGKLRLYANVIMPVAKPAVATMFTLDFLSTWNEFLVQSILITKDSMKTVPYGLLTFVGEFTVDIGLLSAGVLISILPVFVIYLVFQKQFMYGMAGAVKG